LTGSEPATATLKRPLFFLSNDQTEASMRRTITYRGFEIQVEVSQSTDDTFDVTFQIQGGTNLEVLGARGGRIRCATVPSLSDGHTLLPRSLGRPQLTFCLARLTD
jgi:hypothetical protein